MGSLGAIDDRAKRADVTQCRRFEGRSLDSRRPALPVAPFLREVGAHLGQPLSEGREPAVVPAQVGTLALVLIADLGLLLGLASSEHAAGGIQESAPPSPRSAHDVGSFAPMSIREVRPLVTLLLNHALSL